MRYRGYRYDTETGLYYLQSRYYNPEWGRFINADAVAGQVGELLGHNIYAYCKNNPVNMLDPSGFLADFDTRRWEDGYRFQSPTLDEAIELIGIIGFTACSIIEAFMGNPGPLKTLINRVSNSVQKEVQITRVGKWMSEAEHSYTLEIHEDDNAIRLDFHKVNYAVWKTLHHIFMFLLMQVRFLFLNHVFCKKIQMTNHISSLYAY